MRHNAAHRMIHCLVFVLCLCVSCRFLSAQGFVEDWPELHKKDLSKWAAKTSLSFRFVSELTKTATHDDVKDVEEEYFWYTIENVGTKTLSRRGHILLSTWAAGTGHCLTLYVLKHEGAHFEKVWQSNDNLCTESILGAARTQAMPDGRIIVRFREYSEDYDRAKEQPRILQVKLIYKWDGATYAYAGRAARPEPAVSGQ